MLEVKQKLKHTVVKSYPSKEFGNIFYAEILIIPGVGTRPNTQVCHIYTWGQLLMPSIFGILGAYEFFDYT